MTQERANKIFDTDLGRQLNVIYCTTDDRCFIRHGEAQKHSEGKLDEGTEPLTDKTITEWYNDYETQE